MPDELQRVRPLSDDDSAEPATSPPRLTLVLVILAIGGIVGWGFSSFGGSSAETADTEADNNSVARPPTELIESQQEPAVAWSRATSVPGIPSGYEYGGASTPVEFEDSLYLPIGFYHRETQEIRNELWISEDGQTWRSEVLELDAPINIHSISATRHGLIISGFNGNTLAMWSSAQDKEIDGSSWNRIDIDLPEDIAVIYHSTVVNDAGEVVTTIIGESDLWRNVIAPYVPEGIDPQDPNVNLSLADLYLPDGGTSIALFAERPEVVMTDDSVWVRLVTLDGEEILQTHDLPTGAYPVETSPELRYLRVALSWFSSDGVKFLPVIGKNAVPDGYFLPEPWGDGFVAASYELEGSFAAFEDIRLWETNSGRAWQPIEQQPPRECQDFFTVTGGNRILLASDVGNHCVGTVDGEWELVTDVDISNYVVGGPGGFIGYPDGFNYDTALFSPDGTTWTSIQVPAAEPYPTLVPLRDRLFMLSVDPARPGSATDIELWLGDIAMGTPIPHRSE